MAQLVDSDCPGHPERVIVFTVQPGMPIVQTSPKQKHMGSSQRLAMQGQLS